MTYTNDNAKEWRERMAPVPQRVPLEQVVSWWLDMWEWRTAELEAGRGNAYDGHPSYRAPWSIAVTKFPWLTVDDRIEIAPLMESGMKKRSRDNPKMREWYRDMKKENRGFNRR